MYSRTHTRDAMRWRHTYTGRGRLLHANTTPLKCLTPCATSLYNCGSPSYNTRAQILFQIAIFLSPSPPTVYEQSKPASHPPFAAPECAWNSVMCKI